MVYWSPQTTAQKAQEGGLGGMKIVGQFYSSPSYTVPAGANYDVAWLSGVNFNAGKSYLIFYHLVLYGHNTNDWCYVDFFGEGSYWFAMTAELFDVVPTGAGGRTVNFTRTVTPTSDLTNQYLRIRIRAATTNSSTITAYERRILVLEF